ncbi:MAG: YbaN family protein [Methanobrevibacter sp.]|jgi:uncharacterized membrane protein YbaN (DUF454 family)|nr:YbaN family protein [Methanobrevibacter sp.]
MKKKVFLTLGTIFLIIGGVGIFIPVLPTTPLVLLAAFCFSKSSKKAEKWILNNKYFGNYIENYRNKNGVPMDVKIHSLIFLWMVMILSIIIINKFFITMLLVIIALLVSIHIILLKTKKVK